MFGTSKNFLTTQKIQCVEIDVSKNALTMQKIHYETMVVQSILHDQLGQEKNSSAEARGHNFSKCAITLILRKTSVAHKNVYYFTWVTA